MFDLGPNSCVIDVGAFLGETSKELCKSAGADPKNFFLIEPHPGNFDVLQRNMPGYNLHNIAISDHDGEEELFFDLNYTNATSMWREMPAGKGGAVGSFKVLCKTMDTFVKDLGCIDLMMVNAEGAEFKLFAGSTRFLSKVNCLAIHFHGKRECFKSKRDDKRMIMDLLGSAGLVFVDGVHPDSIEDVEKKSHMRQVWKRDNRNGNRP